MKANKKSVGATQASKTNGAGTVARGVRQNKNGQGRSNNSVEIDSQARHLKRANDAMFRAWQAIYESNRKTGEVN